MYGGESIEESGASWLVRGEVLAWTRFGSSIICILILAWLSFIPFLSMNGTSSHAWLLLLPSSVYLLNSIAFSLCAAASIARSSGIDDDFFFLFCARVGAPLLHTGSALGAYLFAIGVSYLLIYDQVFDVTGNAVLNVSLRAIFLAMFALSMLDRVLGAKLRFRLAYMWMAPVYFFIVAFFFHLYIHMGTSLYIYIVQPPSWKYETWQLISLASVCFCTIMMFFVSRLTALCARTWPSTLHDNPWGLKGRKSTPGLYRI